MNKGLDWYCEKFIFARPKRDRLLKRKEDYVLDTRISIIP